MKRKHTLCLLTALALTASLLLSSCMPLSVLFSLAAPRPSETETAPMPTMPEETTPQETWSPPQETLPADPEVQQQFSDFAYEIFAEQVTTDALSARILLADPESYGFTDIPAELVDDELTDDEAYRRELQETMDRLHSFDRSVLGEDMQITYDTLEFWLQIRIDDADTDCFYEPLTPESGEQTMLLVLLSVYTFYDQDDIDTYLAMLASVTDYFDVLAEYEREKSEAGLFMAQSTADKVIANCQSVIDSRAEILTGTFTDRLDQYEQEYGVLDADTRDDYIRLNQTLVEEVVLPAYQDLRDTIEELKSTGPASPVGLCQYEGGKEYYELLSRILLGKKDTPEELLEQLEEDFRNNASALYMLMMMNSDVFDEYDRFSFGMTDPEEILEDLKASSASSYPTPENVTYTVEEIPEALQEYTAKAFYLLPPIDRPSENRIYYNPVQTDEDDDSDLYHSLAHEGYPGHLLQRIYFNDADLLPVRYCIQFLGYTEGWAVYAADRSLANNRNASREAVILRQLDEYMNYELCAICDILVNAEGYSLEDLNNYMSDLGYGSDFQDLYETVAEDPGVYLPYAVGGMEFRQLRTRAESALGEKFDEIAFHKAILDLGIVPLELMEEQMDRWILNQTAQTV